MQTHFNFVKIISNPTFFTRISVHFDKKLFIFIAAALNGWKYEHADMSNITATLYCSHIMTMSIVIPVFLY